MQTYIICGYGIPADIFTDDNYRTYFSIVFNTIFSQSRGAPARIICGGGETNCTPPYQGTEAEVMAEFFRSFMDRESVREETIKWNVILEAKSVSSLENILFAKELLTKENDLSEVTLFCEKTREARNRETVAMLLPESTTNVIGVDFDLSKNRYLPQEIIAKKEAAEREHTQWALQSPENLQKHHAFFVEKIRLLRQWQDEGMTYIDAVARWTKEALEVFASIKNK